MVSESPKKKHHSIPAEVLPNDSEALSFNHETIFVVYDEVSKYGLVMLDVSYNILMSALYFEE